MDPNAIDKMSQEEKLRAMEALWDSLTHGESELQSPAWHEEILASRKSKMQAGKATYVTLDQLQSATPEEVTRSVTRMTS